MTFKQFIQLPIRLYRFLILRSKIKNFPLHSIIFPPYTIQGGENITVGNNTTIRNYGWLMALPLTGSDSCTLRIGNRVRIAFFCHIIATRKIIIGERVGVLGASVGKHCVIGAHSVVTHDIPDYCVAVGIPARIVKRYNFKNQKWENTNPDGSFKNN